jgi:hypothetical protein
MRHQAIRSATVGFCCLVLAIPSKGQDAKPAEKETFPLPPAMFLITYRVASVGANGSIGLESIVEKPEIALPWFPATEGYFLAVAPYYMAKTPQALTSQKPTGSRPFDSLVRVEVVEVAAGGKIKAKSGPEVSEALKVGDIISLVRPGGMTTVQIRELPTVIRRFNPGDPKMGEAGGQAREAARFERSVTNLKRIGLALHNFQSLNGQFPPAVVYGPDGKPWHSWRVLILPFLDGTQLFNQYDFTQPWDGPKNRALIDKMPAVYRDPLNGETTDSSTHYAGLVGEKAFFSSKGSTIKITPFRSASAELFKGRSIAEITDGTSNTLAVAPVDPARKIPWMKPEDITVGADFPKLGQVGGIFTPSKVNGVGKAPILLADGSVKTLTEKTRPDILRALTSINGGEIFSADILTSTAIPRPDTPNRLPTLLLFRDGKKVTAMIEGMNEVMIQPEDPGPPMPFIEQRRPESTPK